MAEIKIEKKKPVWPWIILGLVILAAIIYFFMSSGDINSKNDMVPMERDTISNTGTRQDYNFTENDTAYSRSDEELK